MAGADVAILMKANPSVQRVVIVALALERQGPFSMKPPLTVLGVEREGPAFEIVLVDPRHQDGVSIRVHGVGGDPFILLERGW